MAIQVSGTQVIGNSRELTNIASVDATTATAIGAAGVGGAHTLIQGETAFTTGQTVEFDISTGGYEVYYIDIIGAQHDAPDTTTNFRAQFKDTSNNLITTSNKYVSVGFYGGTTATGFETNSDSFYFHRYNYNDWYKAESYHGKAHISMEIRNSNSTTNPTLLSFRAHYTTGSDPNISVRPMTISEGHLALNQATSKIVLYTQSAGSGINISGSYRMWALK